VNYYLIVYDRHKGEILERADYPEKDRDRAFADRLRKMLDRRGQDDVEVVLFGADSFDDLKKTHSRYFQSSEEILAGIDARKR